MVAPPFCDCVVQMDININSLPVPEAELYGGSQPRSLLDRVTGVQDGCTPVHTSEEELNGGEVRAWEAAGHLAS